MYKRKPAMLNPVPSVQEYPHTQLCRDGYRKTCKIYKLVWEAFNGPTPEKMVVDHIDNDRANSRLDNLQVLSYSQNKKKSYADAELRGYKRGFDDGYKQGQWECPSV